MSKALWTLAAAIIAGVLEILLPVRCRKCRRRKRTYFLRGEGLDYFALECPACRKVADHAH